jgi:gamma-polyglutamate biosynthesis protein CapA
MKIKALFLILIFVLFGTLLVFEHTHEIPLPALRQDPDFLNFISVGDIMLDRGVRASVVKNLDGDYAKLFENLGVFKDADIVFANLEGPVSDVGKDRHNLYSFRMDPASLKAIKDTGISIVSVANNHVGDWGRDAYIDTLAHLKETGILFTGGGNNSAEAETPTIIEKNGMKIGFLAFSDVGPNDMAVTEEKAGLLLASNPHFDEIIKKASTQVDYLVVSFHWGIEYQDLHNKRQEELAHEAVDNGAKLVIGAHPHVPEDTEVYKNSYIAYSLGNFIFDQSWSTATMQGMILSLKLNKNGNLNIRKDTVKLNKFFQPSEIIAGQEEEIKF